MRLILHSGMRSRTLASQTCGSTPLSLAVSIRVQAMAAALPPLGEPMKRSFFRPTASWRARRGCCRSPGSRARDRAASASAGSAPTGSLLPAVSWRRSSAVAHAAGVPGRRAAVQPWPGAWRRGVQPAGRGPASRWRRGRRSVPAPRQRSPSHGRHGPRRTCAGQATSPNPAIAVRVHPAAEARRVFLRSKRLNHGVDFGFEADFGLTA